MKVAADLLIKALETGALLAAAKEFVAEVTATYGIEEGPKKEQPVSTEPTAA